MDSENDSTSSEESSLEDFCEMVLEDSDVAESDDVSSDESFYDCESNKTQDSEITSTVSQFKFSIYIGCVLVLSNT